MDASRLDQETVERLLAGSADGAQTAPPALVRFLDAVRAGPDVGELDGEAAAVAAFRASIPTIGRAAGVPELRPAAGAPGRRPAAGRPAAGGRPARRFAGLLGVKLAVATLAASLTGGVALAAVTGNLPGTTRDEAPPVDTTTSTGTRPTAASTPPGRPSRPIPGPTVGAPDPSAPAGLCAAYQAVAGAERRRALGTPAFAGLVAAAGGPDRVVGYCAALLDGTGAPTGSGTPTPGDPSGRPEHPTGGPPTGVVPTSAPSGPPAGTARPPTAPATTGPLVSPTADTARTPGGPGSDAARTPGGPGPDRSPDDAAPDPTGRRAG
ncbi:hypothetical protein [Micromonospora sp. AKA38]|uniref:hypothetical protein n=1 Tax=Micromonospora sp. AKA38 TaxID=2733861 RepID=UPI0022C60D91|nr:hypothetical protein [Micromonospora sp. AKA38]GHJ12797.1 hypothetical protein TPA0908_07920 [Micromonospora sp. AKA38]